MFPLELKIVYTAFVAMIVVVYWIQYGPGNFLWGSDIALIGAVPALWLEHGLLASMLTLGVLLLESLWNLDFFLRLFFKRSLSGLADYMFDPAKPRWLRAVSLFHVPLPVILLWMVHELGYDERALLWQTLLCWAVLPLTVWLTEPQENVNWVYRPGNFPLKLPHKLYLPLLMIFVPVAIYLPTHWLLGRFF